MSCPICGEKTERKYRPFCSKRCADLDLAKWLNGSYAVPSAEQDDAEAREIPDEENPARPH
ncbi:DNA gyrase inhibitor YacG [Ruegeria sediminis]|uniref:DNA gyrase inhibitor YacG n=1 Tax=Ruegeria sediminis TaxID=2583820 RepID=A0ABY2X3Q4_9RHOB|nr:DNA gyrase inhibitor YacG [Ruegeria sediminis]TMV10024.1 DNA gyrase inhibitor YacG [Ruegeria sediminis]